MTERLQDERAANAPEQDERTYDLDDAKQRQAYIVERLNGSEFEDVPAETAEPTADAAAE